jgi:hypothetical protein
MHRAELIVSIVMEPVTALASIVSLLRIFKQERGDSKKGNHQDFMEWLDYHRHEDLKSFIANTAALRTEVDKVLAADHAVMLQKLDDIQTIVATLLSRVDEFRGLSEAIAPNVQLSEQAVSVLRQFADSGADALYFISYGGGQFCLQPDKGEPFSASESRFLKNDLGQLAALGLISLDYASDRESHFGLTRNGMRYLQAIDGKPSTPAGRHES